MDEALQQLLSNLIDAIGIAASDELVDPYRAHPSYLLPGVKSVIVHLTSLEKTINRYKRGGWWLNRYPHVYHANGIIESWLQERGFKSFAPSPYGSNPRNAVARISFKLAGVKAGLGSWGRNHLLIHPQFGPRVVLGLVLTDAEFPPTRKEMTSFCDNCYLCVKACPLEVIAPSGELDRMRCFYRNRYLPSPCRFPCMEKCPIGKTKPESV